MALPAAEAVFVPAPGELYGDPPVDVSQLYQPTVEYAVQSLNQTSRIRGDGKVVPTIDVAFEITGHPGLFDILIDNYAFTYADPIEYMYQRSYLLKSIFALPATLPPFDYGALIGTGPVVTLEAVSVPASAPDTVNWAGTINPRGPAATATFAVTLLGEPEPFLVSAEIGVPASTLPVAESGTLGPLLPGSYTAELAANNGKGIGTSADLAFTIP